MYALSRKSETYIHVFLAIYWAALPPLRPKNDAEVEKIEC